MESLKYAKHPLDQLHPNEIKKAVEIVKKEKLLFGKRHRFLAVDLLEPLKSFVLSYKNGQDFERHAVMAVSIDNDRQLFEVEVNITKAQVTSWKLIPEGQPAILGDEFFEVDEALKKSELFQAALKRRGITNPNLVWWEPWSVGNYGLSYEKPGSRLMMAICFLQLDNEDNAYAHPIDGLVPIVDMHQMKVIHVDEFQPALPIPQTCFHYEKKKVHKTFRTDLKPLLLSQPKGPSFTVVNNEVAWQKWSFHVGFNAREGLVLHNIKYNDNGKLRHILYRASLSEMVVPYGDPRPQHIRKNAFDVGDYGIGRSANSLKKGCDCFGEIHYFDGYINDSKGDIICIKNAVCLHEEDNGILWKHTNWRSGEAETRRSRRLVISMFATADNYDYGFYWYFYLDGSIEFEAKLTGVIHLSAAFDDEKPKHGTIIAPNLYAPIHQHFFCIRLDMAVDGVNNSVYEVNIEAEKPGAYNPQHNGFYPEFRLLKTDSDAVGHVDSRKHRFWKIINPTSINHQTGQPVSYRLETHGTAFPYAGPEASVTKRAGFIKNHVWITRYDPDQLFAAGKYPNQHSGGDGLEKWISGKQSITDTDVVLCTQIFMYTLGTFHLPCCEDFPVMPVATAKFRLKPDGFFAMNPANDVPPSCKLERDVVEKDAGSFGTSKL